MNNPYNQFNIRPPLQTRFPAGVLPGGGMNYFGYGNPPLRASPMQVAHALYPRPMPVFGAANQSVHSHSTSDQWIGQQLVPPMMNSNAAVPGMDSWSFAPWHSAQYVHGEPPANVCDPSSVLHLLNSYAHQHAAATRNNLLPMLLQNGPGQQMYMNNMPSMPPISVPHSTVSATDRPLDDLDVPFHQVEWIPPTTSESAMPAISYALEVKPEKRNESTLANFNATCSTEKTRNRDQSTPVPQVYLDIALDSSSQCVKEDNQVTDDKTLYDKYFGTDLTASDVVETILSDELGKRKGTVCEDQASKVMKLDSEACYAAQVHTQPQDCTSTESYAANTGTDGVLVIDSSNQPNLSIEANHMLELARRVLEVQSTPVPVSLDSNSSEHVTSRDKVHTQPQDLTSTESYAANTGTEGIPVIDSSNQPNLSIEANHMLELARRVLEVQSTPVPDSLDSNSSEHVASRDKAIGDAVAEESLCNGQHDPSADTNSLLEADKLLELEGIQVSVNQDSSEDSDDAAEGIEDNVEPDVEPDTVAPEKSACCKVSVRNSDIPFYMECDGETDSSELRVLFPSTKLQSIEAKQLSTDIETPMYSKNTQTKSTQSVSPASSSRVNNSVSVDSSAVLKTCTGFQPESETASNDSDDVVLLEEDEVTAIAVRTRSSCNKKRVELQGATSDAKTPLASLSHLASLLASDSRSTSSAQKPCKTLKKQAMSKSYKSTTIAGMLSHTRSTDSTTTQKLHKSLMKDHEMTQSQNKTTSLGSTDAMSLLSRVGDSGSANTPPKPTRNTSSMASSNSDDVIIVETDPVTSNALPTCKAGTQNLDDIQSRLDGILIKTSENSIIRVQLQFSYFGFEAHSNEIFRLLAMDKSQVPVDVLAKLSDLLAFLDTNLSDKQHADSEKSVLSGGRRTLMFQCLFCPYAELSAKRVMAHLKQQHGQYTSFSQNSVLSLPSGPRTLFIYCRHCDFVAYDSGMMWIHFAVFHKVPGILLQVSIDPGTNLTPGINADLVADKFPFYCCTKCSYINTERLLIIGHVFAMHPELVFVGCVVKLLIIDHNHKFRKFCTYRTLATEGRQHVTRKEIYACVKCPLYSFYPSSTFCHYIDRHCNIDMLYMCAVTPTCLKRCTSLEHIVLHVNDMHDKAQHSHSVRCTATVLNSSTLSQLDIRPGQLTAADVPIRASCKFTSVCAQTGSDAAIEIADDEDATNTCGDDDDIVVLSPDPKDKDGETGESNRPTSRAAPGEQIVRESTSYESLSSSCGTPDDVEPSEDCTAETSPRDVNDEQSREAGGLPQCTGDSQTEAPCELQCNRTEQGLQSVESSSPHDCVDVSGSRLTACEPSPDKDSVPTENSEVTVANDERDISCTAVDDTNYQSSLGNIESTTTVTSDINTPLTVSDVARDKLSYVNCSSEKTADLHQEPAVVDNDSSVTGPKPSQSESCEDVNRLDIEEELLMMSEQLSETVRREHNRSVVVTAGCSLKTVSDAQQLCSSTGQSSVPASTTNTADNSYVCRDTAANELTRTQVESCSSKTDFVPTLDADPSPQPLVETTFQTCIENSESESSEQTDAIAPSTHCDASKSSGIRPNAANQLRYKLLASFRFSGSKFPSPNTSKNKSD